MDKWEYRIVYMSSDEQMNIDHMNKLGTMGWEAYGTHYYHRLIVYFKRKI